MSMKRNAIDVRENMQGILLTLHLFLLGEIDMNENKLQRFIIGNVYIFSPFGNIHN